jgi:hypothetical protein
LGGRVTSLTNPFGPATPNGEGWKGANKNASQTLLNMDVVSFETAKKLKEAGFPQPEPAFGQVWYESAGSPIIVTSGWEAGFAFVGPRSAMAQTTYMKRFQEQNGVFAPTATDILKAIQSEYSTPCLIFDFKDGQWEVGDFSHSEWYTMTSHKTNPAEACAAAWLANH